GVIYDPAGKNPLHGVLAYVPNYPLGDFHPGAECVGCAALYDSPVAIAVTDAQGRFTITNMPVGKNVPLVVQVGKWRMLYKLSNVQSCQANDAATLAGGPLHLPRNHAEGDLPN